MVTQEVQLFEASVRANLTFFNPAITSAQIEATLKNLRLWDWCSRCRKAWIRAWQVEQEEALLLAGCRRASPAAGLRRVFLKDPGLVILDEASSRLDPSREPDGAGG